MSKDMAMTNDMVALADMVDRIGLAKVLKTLTEVKDLDAACGIEDDRSEEAKEDLDFWTGRLGQLLFKRPLVCPSMLIIVS